MNPAWFFTIIGVVGSMKCELLVEHARSGPTIVRLGLLAEQDDLKVEWRE